MIFIAPFRAGGGGRQLINIEAALNGNGICMGNSFNSVHLFKRQGLSLIFPFLCTLHRNRLHSKQLACTLRRTQAWNVNRYFTAYERNACARHRPEASTCSELLPT